MKKISITVALCLCAVLFSGCGSTEKVMEAIREQAGSDAKAETVIESSEEKRETETETETEAEEETTKVVEEETEEKNQETNISEQVLYESDIVRITFTGEEESFMGVDLMLKIENLSDKAITVSTNDTSVNGVMVDSYLYTEITAGKTANEEISFYESELEASGISELGTIEMSFEINDSDSWDTLEETDVIRLTLRETAAAEQADGVVVYEADGLKITYTGLKIDEIWGTSVNFAIQNDMGTDISVSTDNVSVDDVMSDAFLYEDIKNGKYCNAELYFYDELEGTPKSMELSFNVYDSDSYDTLAETDIITIDLS